MTAKIPKGEAIRTILIGMLKLWKNPPHGCRHNVKWVFQISAMFQCHAVAVSLVESRVKQKIGDQQPRDHPRQPLLGQG